ncbi:L-serine ammonia-lyase, iron-sulfur-dependent, subunit alpha [Schleiferilactobacillus shenzhenensis]|uniref:L-serine dehydratase n=1 Tax=Schleiferilactobacillus shenzhenensis LY-73 TaxID=1231336 RepID=U4TU84_9LACO|nr:L-serine ammonia-lyase, iron-sulfur-dependent, subunit alpha [Schleiferilactobacillus shenzhenensis]ERL65433.1 SdaAA [Schleiferilactobacillus shenzhenensis LY-73]
MFYTIKDLVAQSAAYPSIAAMMVALEEENTNRSAAEIRRLMGKNLDAMVHSVHQGIAGVKSVTGLTGMEAKKMDGYLAAGDFLSGRPILEAVRNAIAVNEVNAKMGLICATPTAGSAGVLAGVLLAVRDRLGLSRDDQVDFLFTAGAFGLVIANNAGIAGAEGGCQEEVGSASAMASAALVCAKGGTAQQAANAVAMTLQNMLGLICDPVAGLVEVPCVKRNALGASQAMISADMALAGLKSVIPVDETVEAMRKVGLQMPSAFKETAEGGLATTPTALKLKQQIFGDRA